MAKDKRYLYCEFDVCERKLVDLCFVCKQDGKYYCDEICAERNLEAQAPKERITWQ